MGEEIASGVMGVEDQHHHVSTPAEGSRGSKEEEERKGTPQHSPSTWKASGLLAAGESCTDWRRD